MNTGKTPGANLYLATPYRASAEFPLKYGRLIKTVPVTSPCSNFDRDT